MPSHLAPAPTPTVPSEMPPPLFTPEIPEIITDIPLIDQFGIGIIVATSIIAGIVVFIVFRRSRKK